MLTCSDNPVADADSVDLHPLSPLLSGYDGQAVEGVAVVPGNEPEKHK